MSKPRFFYFDLGNVIFHFDHGTMCEQAAKVAGIATDEARRLLFDAELQNRLEIGAISPRVFYEKFRDATKMHADPSEFMLAVSDIFSLNVDIVPVVGQLAAARNRLGILSNTCGPHWQHLSDGRYGILPDLFERAILSYQVQAAKPDPAIYEVAIEQSGIAADEVFFVDDRPENVAAARDVGIDAVQFTGAADLADALHRRGVEFNY